MNRLFIPCILLASGCGLFIRERGNYDRVVPAESFSRAVKAGQFEEYSFFQGDRGKGIRDDAVGRRVDYQRGRLREAGYPDGRFANRDGQGGERTGLQHLVGKTNLISGDGLRLRRSLNVASSADRALAASRDRRITDSRNRFQGRSRIDTGGPMPGSSAPYVSGQKSSNPSLWPDAGRQASLFRDFRGFQPMDLITIRVNERSEGKKQADTTTKGQFDLLAGITELFGIETSKFAANNTSLDPTSLIQANTNTQFKGEGDTTRKGSLVAKISAVVMEVLPNGLIRIEGSKIVSLNDEEEVMVVSGLIRPFDVDSNNEVDSSRVANMRIDFYGRGILAEQQTPGWGARLFEMIWPF